MDLDRFVGWLITQEVPENFHALYRQGAAKIIDCANGGPVQPKHVDQAIKRAEAVGAPVRMLANLQKVGDALVRFQRESPAAAAPGVAKGVSQVECQKCGKRQPVSRSGDCLFCGAHLPVLSGPPSAAHGADGERLCRACGGKVVFYDGRQAGGVAGGAGGLMAAGTAWAVGLLGALTVLCAMGLLSSLAAAASMKFRCDSCWTALPGSSVLPEERHAMLKVRAILVAAAVGLGALAVALAAVWIIVAAHRGRGVRGFPGR